jgi:uncharacterized protein (TIGR02001 family)
MKKLIGIAMLASAATAGAANAEVAGNVTFVSDYVFRGISQSDGGPAIQGSFTWSQDMFYAGAWGSSTNLGIGESMELDLYAGFTPTTGPINWDIGLVGYFYPGADDSGAEADYMEGIVKGSMDLTEQFSLGGAVAYSPEYFGETGDATYWEINGGFAVSEATRFTAAYGVQDVDAAPGDYSTWNIGVTHAVHGFTLGATYSDTEDAFENGYALDSTNSDGRFVISIGRSL